MLTDPVFWLAVAVWVFLIVLAVAVCCDAKRKDRQFQDAYRTHLRGPGFRR